jgi:hypothetical protein
MNQIHLGKFYFISKYIFFLSLFRTRLLSDVYSLLADLIEWSDHLLLLKLNDPTIQINDDNKYKKIAQDLIQAIKVTRIQFECIYIKNIFIQNCISLACDTSSSQSVETRSDSFHSFQSTNR